MKWSITFLLLFTFLAILTHLSAREAEQRHPAVGDFAQIDGVPVHYTDTGTGSAIVLIHGASTSLLDFRASIVEHLSREYCVISVDRPGHGHSERPSGVWPDPAEQARTA